MTNAIHCRWDFRLQPDSPPLALSFRQIPVAEIGLYPDPLHVTRPVHTDVRYPDGMPTPDSVR